MNSVWNHESFDILFLCTGIQSNIIECGKHTCPVCQTSISDLTIFVNESYKLEGNLDNNEEMTPLPETTAGKFVSEAPLKLRETTSNKSASGARYSKDLDELPAQKSPSGKIRELA